MESIKNLRLEAGLKQKDIANYLGIKRSTYASYEIERDIIPIKRLNNLCNYFNISIDYALGITNVKNYPCASLEINRELFQKRIKALRKDAHLTQQEMANILNISRSTWTGYEYGKYQMPTIFLYALSKKYHVSIDYLLGKIDINPLP